MAKIIGIPVKNIGDKFKALELNEVVAVVNDNATALEGVVSGYQGDVVPSFNLNPSTMPKGVYTPLEAGNYGPTGNKYLQVPINPDTNGDSYIYQIINNGITLELQKTKVPTANFALKGGIDKTIAQIDGEKLNKSEILSLGSNPTFGVDLVGTFANNQQYTTSKTTTIAFQNGGRSAFFPIKEGYAYQIQTLNASLSNSNWGKLFNVLGNTIYTLTSADVTTVDGSQVVIIPSGIGVVEAGLNIATADQTNFIFREITSGLKIKDGRISSDITRNADIINQTNDPGEPNNKYTGLVTGIWDQNTAIGSPVTVIATAPTYSNWRAGVLFPVVAGQTWLIRNRNDIGSSFGVFADAGGNKIANALSTMLTSVGDHMWTFTIPTGATQAGLHTNNTSSYPSTGVTVTRPASEIGKLKNFLLPKSDGVEKKTLSGVWNACGTSITFYDGTIYANGPQAGQITKGYQSWVQDYVSFPDGVRNYGLGGHSWAVQSELPDNVITNKMGTWQAAKYWSAEGATNDFKLNVVIGIESDFINNTGNGTLYGAMRVFVDKVYSLQSDSVIIFITDPHRNNDGYTSYSVNSQGNTLEDYHDVFRWVANRLGAPLCDTFRRGGVNDYNLSSMTRDGLHPIDVGYRVMAREVATVFQFI